MLHRDEAKSSIGSKCRVRIFPRFDSVQLVEVFIDLGIVTLITVPPLLDRE
jgi:hypothetical protein